MAMELLACTSYLHARNSLKQWIMPGPQARRGSLKSCLSVLPEVECNSLCQEILRTRMQEGLLPQAAVHGDVCTYEPSSQVKAKAKVLSAGFPCQVPGQYDFISCDFNCCWVFK